jgi:nicotinamidase-related amidase
MHQSLVPPALREFAAGFRGEVNTIPIDPAKTAHLVVDLQIGFMAEGAPVEVPVARDVVTNVNRISKVLRKAGGTVIYIQFEVDLNEPLHWGPMYDRMLPENRQRFADAFRKGAEPHKLWPGLDIQAKDLIIAKTRFSAFIPGTCELDTALNAKGIDTLIVTGTVSNCCCESTVRDAMQLGYKVLFVEDATASFTDEAHNATLANMVGLLFADVVTVDETIVRIEKAMVSAEL